MNPSQIAQPEQLYGASIHAGGWPKLGWSQADESDDDTLTCYDEGEGAQG